MPCCSMESNSLTSTGKHTYIGGKHHVLVLRDHAHWLDLIVTPTARSYATYARRTTPCIVVVSSKFPDISTRDLNSWYIKAKGWHHISLSTFIFPTPWMKIFPKKNLMLCLSFHLAGCPFFENTSCPDRINSNWKCFSWKRSDLLSDLKHHPILFASTRSKLPQNHLFFFFGN